MNRGRRRVSDSLTPLGPSADDMASLGWAAALHYPAKKRLETSRAALPSPQPVKARKMTTEGRIPTLDGLRAVAIFIVMMAHGFRDNSKLAVFGRTGVLIFFALSGYLITTRLLGEYRKSGRISLRNFYLRRAFRILPPAIAYLAILSTLVAFGVVSCNFYSIFGALLFYVNYLPVDALSWHAGHFWSLSVEEHFYLLWPPLLIAFGVMRGWRTALILAAGVIVWRGLDHHFNILANVFHAPYLSWNGHGTDAVADTLLWGCVLAFFKFKPSPRVSIAIACVAAMLLAALTMGLDLLNANIDLALEDFLPAVMLGAIVSCPQSWIGRFLDLAPTRFVGNLSYSLYIWQQLFLGGPEDRLPTPVGVAAAFACAYLSYRFIEQPAIRLGKRVIVHRILPAAA